MRVTDRNDVIIIDNLATGPAGSPSTPGRVEAGAGSRGAPPGLGRSSPTPMMRGTRRRSCFLRWPGRRGCRARSPVWILRCRWDSQGVALGRGCGGDLCRAQGVPGAFRRASVRGRHLAGDPPVPRLAKGLLPSNEANVTGTAKNSGVPAFPGSYNAHHSIRGEGYRQT